MYFIQENNQLIKNIGRRAISGNSCILDSNIFV